MDSWVASIYLVKKVDLVVEEPIVKFNLELVAVVEDILEVMVVTTVVAVDPFQKLMFWNEFVTFYSNMYPVSTFGLL